MITGSRMFRSNRKFVAYFFSEKKKRKKENFSEFDHEIHKRTYLYLIYILVE